MAEPGVAVLNVSGTSAGVPGPPPRIWPKGKEPRGVVGANLAEAIDAAEANADQ
jgi:hypothetical protein